MRDDAWLVRRQIDDKKPVLACRNKGKSVADLDLARASDAFERRDSAKIRIEHGE